MRRHAFTLIEILITMSIMAILGTGLFALVGSASTSSDKMEVGLLIERVEAGLDQFSVLSGSVALPTGSRADARSGSWYPAENTGSWERQALMWRLNHKMTKEILSAAKAYADEEDLRADPYQDAGYWKATKPGISDWERVAFKQEALNAISDAEADFYKGRYTGSWAEVPSDAISHGSTGDIPDQFDEHFTNRGHVKRALLSMRGRIARDLAIRTFQSYEILDETDIGSDFMFEDTIIDVWGNPLVYVAHSSIGVPYVKAAGPNASDHIIKVGSDPAGRTELNDRNDDGLINEEDWKHAPLLVLDLNKDGNVDQDDWASILYYARPSRGRMHYIASAGEDGIFDCVRFNTGNEDNIENDY